MLVLSSVKLKKEAGRIKKLAVGDGVLPVLPAVL
jgi:hypothetical protein